MCVCVDECVCMRVRQLKKEKEREREIVCARLAWGGRVDDGGVSATNSTSICNEHIQRLN